MPTTSTTSPKASKMHAAESPTPVLSPLAPPRGTVPKRAGGRAPEGLPEAGGGNGSGFYSHPDDPSAVGLRQAEAIAEDVKVVIQYCELGNYSQVARDQERAIRAEFAGFSVDVARVSSHGGIYEVTVNGKLIFSKRATCRLPGDDEIFYHVRAAMSFPPVRPPSSVGPDTWVRGARRRSSAAPPSATIPVW